MRRDVFNGTSHVCFVFTMVALTPVVALDLALLWVAGFIIIDGGNSLAFSPSLTSLFFLTAPRVIGGARVAARARVTIA